MLEDVIPDAADLDESPKTTSQTARDSGLRPQTSDLRPQVTTEHLNSGGDLRTAVAAAPPSATPRHRAPEPEQASISLYLAKSKDCSQKPIAPKGL